MKIKTIIKFVKAFCYNLIQEQVSPGKGYRVYFRERRSRLKIDAITNASLINEKITVNYVKMPFWRKLQIYFAKCPAFCALLILFLLYPELRDNGLPIIFFGTIAYDAVASGNITGSHTLTFSHTCSGANRVLAVAVSIGGNGFSGNSPQSVTYNGVSMTKQVEGTGGNAGVSSIWTLVNPATGANNVVITLSGTESMNINAGAISFTGAHQTSPVDGTGANSAGSATSQTVNITTSYNNTFIVDSLYVNSVTETLNIGTGQTSRWSITSNFSFRGSTKQLGTAGSTSMNWTWTNSQYSNLVCLGIRENVTAWSQTCSETLVLSDTLLKSPSRVLSEILNLSDTFSGGKLYTQVLSEITSLTDSVFKVSARTLTETITFTDTVLKTVSRTLSETLSLADSFLRTIGRTFSETLTIFDTLRKLLNGASVIFTNKTKNATVFTNKTKNATTFTNKAKNATTFTNKEKI